MAGQAAPFQVADEAAQQAIVRRGVNWPGNPANPLPAS
jgi:hypothetical protein